MKRSAAFLMALSLLFFAGCGSGAHSSSLDSVLPGDWAPGDAETDAPGENEGGAEEETQQPGDAETDGAEENEQQPGAAPMVYPSDPGFATFEDEVSCHDPSLIKAEDGSYYVFGSHNVIYKSNDLIHFSFAGHYFPPAPSNAANASDEALREAGAWASTNPWAPDVVRGADGKYWLYYSASSFGSTTSYIGLAKADRITGPYAHTAEIVRSAGTAAGTTQSANAIDPQIVYEKGDPARDMYMVYGSFGAGIHVVKLDRETGTLAPLEEQPQGSVRYTADRQGVTHTLFAGKKIAGGAPIATQGDEGPEGPTMLYRETVTNGQVKGYYYLMVSYGSLFDTYNMKVFRSESPTGPFTDSAGRDAADVTPATVRSWGDKVLGSIQWGSRGSYKNQYFAPGHNDVFTDDDGQSYIVYHCRNTSTNGNHRLFVNRLAFDSQGRMYALPNRYAGETLCDLPPAALDGEYRIALLKNDDYRLQTAKTVRIDNGTVTGDFTGTCSVSGYEVTLTLNGVAYDGVAAPQWIWYAGKAGLSISARSRDGDAVMLNREPTL